MIKEIQKGKDYTFEFELFKSGLQLIPTSATVSITNNGASAVVTAQSCTIDTSGNTSYTLLAAKTGTVARNYRLELSYVYAGKTTIVFYLFDIVETPIQCIVTDDDIFTYLNELRDKVKERTTTINSGTTSSFISTALVSDSRDYKGGYVTVYHQASSDCGQTESHEGRITAYDKTTGAVTFTPAAPFTIATDDSANIRPSFDALIKRMFSDHVLRDIRNNVGLAAGYIDSSLVSAMVIYKTLETYCFSQVEVDGDKWQIRSSKYRELYQEEYNKLQSGYDKDENGQIDDEENAFKPSAGMIDLIR